jgi:hypothetical protein
MHPWMSWLQAATGLVLCAGSMAHNMWQPVMPCGVSGFGKQS